MSQTGEESVMSGAEEPELDVADHPVADLMSHPVCVVPATAPLDYALRVMLSVGLRHLVAVDTAGQFVGVLDDRRIAAAWARDPAALDSQPVTAVLDPTPAVVSRTATIGTAARVMRDYQTDAVVVVDTDRRAVGVLTAGDVVAAVARTGLATAASAS
jgi:CBS domain-containing membrane protein